LDLISRGIHVGKVHRIKRKSIIGQLVIIVLGVEALFFASFTALEVPTATAHNLNSFIQGKIQLVVGCLPDRIQQRIFRAVPRIATATQPVRYTLYVPQAAAAIFVGYALGWPLATIAACLFCLVGLIGPVFNFHPFAAGGGMDYYLQPGFGYLIGMVLATAVVGAITKDHRTSLRQAAALLAGLVTVHLVGLAYLLGVCLFFTFFEDLRSSPVWSQWVFEQARNLTWYTLPYDFLFALVLIGLGFPFRWLAGILIAPDIAFRNKYPTQQSIGSPRPVGSGIVG
jgi:biotin transporter BioY